MLSPEVKLILQQKYFPRLYEQTFEPVQAVLRGCAKDGVALDAGSSGGTWVLRTHRTQLRLLVGVDICLPAQSPAMPFVLSDLHRVPFADNAFDLVVCYNVIEHLSQPYRVFAEFRRILKGGGVLVFKTSSLYAPVVWVSRLTSHHFHQRMKSCFTGAKEAEVFPTYYRCNTPGALERCLHSVGFRRQYLSLVDQTYEYLAFSKLAYILGLLYSRVIQSSPLRVFGTGIVGVYIK